MTIDTRSRRTLDDFSEFHKIDGSKRNRIEKMRDAAILLSQMAQDYFGNVRACYAELDQSTGNITISEFAWEPLSNYRVSNRKHCAVPQGFDPGSVIKSIRGKYYFELRHKQREPRYAAIDYGNIKNCAILSSDELESGIKQLFFGSDTRIVVVSPQPRSSKFFVYHSR